MSDRIPSPRLEKRYRLLLLSYPASYRAARSEELIATLMAAAEPGRTAPSVADAADLVYNGVRTRVRLMRRTARSPIGASALHHAGVVTLSIASAVSVAIVVGVGVLGQPMFAPGQRADDTYLMPVRIALGVVLATLPLALACLVVGRPRVARRLTIVGGAGSIGFAAWLVAHALTTRTEHLEASNLFGLVALLSLPGVLLCRGVSVPMPRARTGWWMALAGALAAPFVLLVSADALLEANRVYADHIVFTQGPGALHDTALTQAIVVALVFVGVWHFGASARRPNDPRLPAVTLAISIPPLAYALGTLLTPIVFRPELVVLPGLGRTVDLAPHLLEVVVALGVAAVLSSLVLGSLRRATQSQP